MTQSFSAGKPMFVIKVVRPSRPSAAQTVLDREHSIRRRRAVGWGYDQMCTLLTRMTGGKMTRCALLQLAAAYGIRIDRTAKRMKDCLICWFCENWGRLRQPPIPQAPPVDDTTWMDDIDSPAMSFDFADVDDFAEMEWN
jgi:hypothetical protein